MELICFCLFFHYLYKNKKAKKVILYLILPIVLFWSVNFFFNYNENFNSKALIFEFIFFLFVIIYYFFEKMIIVTNNSIHKSISFWICIGLFLYFAGNFFFLLFSDYTKDVKFLNNLKIIYTFVTISKDIILALAWFAHEKIETDADIIKIPEGLELDADLNFLNASNNNNS
jgi:hypothetical protein